jgi:thiazole/oxazole-forming peptide maturase SagD family component
VPTAPGCPVLVSVCRVSAVREDDDTVRYASGRGETPDEAIERCALERAERTSAQFHGDEQMVRATPTMMDRPAVLPPDIMLFSEAQYASHAAERQRNPYPDDFPGRWSDALPVDWVKATAAISSAEAWLPAGLCYLGHGRDRAAGLVPADTNGLAAGASVEDAAIRAFVELVERDAVALWWYNRVSRPQLDLADIGSALVRRYAEWTVSRNRPLRLIDLTHDCGIAVIAAIAHDHDGRFIALGFGAGASASDAAHHALGELAQCECNIALIERRGSEAGSTPEALALLRWWREGRIDQSPHLRPAPISPPAQPRGFLNLSACHDICGRLGLRFLALDMTRPGCRTPVVRVFAPGLRPMWARFAPGRLFDVPVRLGWLSRPLDPHELNTIPIMF